MFNPWTMAAIVLAILFIAAIASILGHLNEDE